jgi:hypothetical protein
MVGTTAAGPLPAVSLRSGTVKRAAARAAITWCDPGMVVVVWVSTPSHRSWAREIVLSRSGLSLRREPGAGEALDQRHCGEEHDGHE